MKRILLILVALVTFSAGLTAQSFTVTPSPVNATGDVSILLLETPSMVVNNTDEVLNLRWERIEEIPAEWQTTICDNVLCWAPTRSASNFTLQPGAQGLMKPGFRSNSIAGEGMVRMLIYDPLDSLDTVQEHIYTADIQMVVSVEEPEEIDFMFYPNPATNFVVLPESNRISSAVLYNITGQQVKTFNMAANTRRFDIMDVVRGTYLLQFIDETGTILHTARLTKK